MLFQGQCPKCGGPAATEGGVVICGLCGESAEVTDLDRLKKLCQEDGRFREISEVIKRTENDDSLEFSTVPQMCRIPSQLMSCLPTPNSDDFSAKLVHCVAFFLGFLEHFEELPEQEILKTGEEIEVCLLRSQSQGLGRLAELFETTFEELLVLAVWLTLEHESTSSSKN